MTEKRFNMEYVHENPTIWHITDCGEHIPDEKLCDLLNELNDENEQLKKLTLYFLSCATGETSSNYDKDMDIWCNEIFGCNYQEADKKYGDDESIWELGNKIFKEKEELGE